MISLQAILWIGLFGAFLMFLGDMTLYYDKADYCNDGTLNPVIAIMKGESRQRLYLGGLLGPVAAFVYCIGFYHLVLFFVNEAYMTVMWGLFLMNCFGIILGGAYHSHCAYLGLIGRHKEPESLQEVLNYLKVQKKTVFGIQAIGVLGLAAVILAGWTMLPRWMAFFTPGILLLLLPMVRKLPKGFHMIICGGWTNLIFVIYYALAIIVLAV